MNVKFRFILISVLSFFAICVLFNEDVSADSNITITQTNGNNGETEFERSDSRVSFVNLEIKRADQSLKDHYVKVVVSGGFVTSFTLTKPALASSVEYVDEGANKVAYIKFPNLTTGTILSFPIIIKTETVVAPKGLVTTVVAELLDSSRKTILKSADYSTKLVYKPMTHQIGINTEFKDSADVFAGRTSGSKIMPSDTVPVKFVFSVNGRFFEGLQNSRATGEYKLTVKLPPYATFKKVGKNNTGWFLSADKKTVSRTVVVNNLSEWGMSNYLIQSIKEQSLYFEFPNAELNKSYEIESTFESIPYKIGENEAHEIAKGSSNYVFKSAPVGDFFSKNVNNLSNIPDTKYGKSISYYFGFELKNPTESVIKNFEFVDDGLDKRLEYDKFYLSSVLFDLLSGNPVYGYDGNGKKIVLDGVMKNSNYEYNLPKGIVKLGFKLSEMPKDFSSNFYSLVRLKNPDLVFFDPINNNKNILINEATVTGDLDYGKYIYPLEATDSDNLKIIKDNRYAQLYSYLSKDGFLEGEKTQIDIRSLLANEDVERKLDGKIVALLPKGIEYKENSKFPNLKVIPNYKDSGKTAIIGNVEGVEGKLSFDVLVTRNAEQGDNIVESWFYYDGEQVPLLFSSADRYDVNENGDKKELLAYQKLNVKYIPAKEIVATKQLKKESMSEWLLNDMPVDEKTKQLDYKLVVNNYLDQNVNDLTIYDVFPNAGDKMIVTNKEGVRESRGSNIALKLIDKILPVEGYDIYYSIKKVDEDEVKSVKSDDWFSSVTDYSKVTAIKVVMKKGNQLKAKGKVEVPFKMNLPENFKKGNEVSNTFAISTNKNVSFSESNKANAFSPLKTLVELDVKKIQIFTEKYSNGLPVKLFVDKKILDEKGNKETVKLAFYEEKTEKLLYEKVMKVADIKEVTELKVPASALAGKARKAIYVAKFEEYDSESVKFKGDNDSVGTYGFTATESKFESDADSAKPIEKKYVVMTERLQGEAIKYYYEYLTLKPTKPINVKAGYGIETNFSYVYSTDLTPVERDYSKLPDPQMKVVTTKDMFDSTMSFRSFGSEQAEISLDRMNDFVQNDVLYGEYAFPETIIEKGSGDSFDKRITNFDESRFVLGGRKYYIPIWLGSLGDKEFSYVMDQPQGYNLFTWEVKNPFKVTAYMYATIGSTTINKDELLIEPVYTDSKEPKGWSDSEKEWLKK